MNQKTFPEAIKEYYEEYPDRAVTPVCDWHFVVHVMEKIGHPIVINFEKTMPSPYSVTRAWQKYWEEEEKRARGEGNFVVGRESSKNFSPLFHSKQDTCPHLVRYEKDGTEQCGGCGKILKVIQ